MSRRSALFISIAGATLILLSVLWCQSAKEEVMQAHLAYSNFIEDQEEELQPYLKKLKADSRSEQLFQNAKEWNLLHREKELSFFVLKGDELLFWSEDESPVQIEQLREAAKLIATPTSLHLRTAISAGDTLFVALKGIAYNYPYDNPYLQSHIHADYLPYLEQLNQAISVDQSNFNWPTRSKPSEEGSWRYFLSGLLFLFGIGLMMWGLSKLKLVDKNFEALALILLAVLFRWWILNFDPMGWQNSFLFDPAYFSLSQWFPSTGDLFLNSALTFLIIYQLSRIARDKISRITYLLTAILLLFFAYFSLQLIADSITNSQFSFELDNLFKLNLHSYFSLIAFGLLFMAKLVLVKVLFFNRKAFEKSWQADLILMIFIVGFYFLNPEPADLSLLQLVMLVGLYLFFLAASYFRKSAELLFPFLILLMFSLLSNLIMKQVMEKKEISNREVILMKLAEEKDPLLEYLFKDVQNQIREDDSLRTFFDYRWSERNDYQNYLRNKYFNGYWDRYRINLTLCSDEDSLIFGSNEAGQNCYYYFQDRIYLEGEQISSINLFQLKNLAGRIDYIGEIDLSREDNYRLFLELSRDYFSEDLGYPELFLNQEDRELHRKLDEYSYAVYYQNELINSQGDRVYTNLPDEIDFSESSLYSYETENFYNTALNKNENIVIVLSKEKVSTLDYMSRITYLLIIYGLIFLILSISLRTFPFYQRLHLTDFSTKIRLLVSASLLTALLLFLAGTTYYIKEQYEEKNSRAIEEKLRSISLELFQKVGDSDTLVEEQKSYLTALLIKFSNVFYTDINLYQSNGKLYASSRPELFQQDLKSIRMHPIAYSDLVKADRSKLVQEESIGELGYLSAYIPFKNGNNELLAYLNLPYFARQEELEEEIAAFLVPTINIYVIIFTISLMISILLINQISRPLLLIRRHISSLKLGGETDLIEWQSEDEIGELVKEYNRIAIELGESAEELAKSERETAWREMAKQIAHEIKNPLTPMKLSIQHLQGAASGKDGNLEEKIKKTSDTLIAQIESLTAIAEAFSSFAKFPDKELQEIDLRSIMQEVAYLYVDQANIEMDDQLIDRKALILADRDLVLRILNNLIKNAVQAYDGDKSAWIQIKLYEEEANAGKILLSVIDQGKGISEDQGSHIFEPSFTTKSSGTGLGLAIVKRSMEQMGGKVEMKSELGKGSQFTLYFPKA